MAPVERIVASARQWLGQQLGIERAETQREFIAQAQRQSQSRGIRM